MLDNTRLDNSSVILTYIFFLSIKTQTGIRPPPGWIGTRHTNGKTKLFWSDQNP